MLQDPEEYYDPPGGFLTYISNVSSLLAASAPAANNKQLDNFAGHFALVNHQLREVRLLFFGLSTFQPSPRPAVRGDIGALQPA